MATETRAGPNDWDLATEGTSGGHAAFARSVINFGNAYETVAASQTAQVLGSTGAIGDYLSHVVISPATTSPGNVIVYDDSTAIYTFAGGASSVTGLNPFIVPLGVKSVNGAFKVTTGTNVAVTATGSFT